VGDPPAGDPESRADPGRHLHKPERKMLTKEPEHPAPNNERPAAEDHQQPPLREHRHRAIITMKNQFQFIFGRRGCMRFR